MQGECESLGYFPPLRLRPWLACCLTGPASLYPSALLAVRSDYHCALWKVSKQGHPAPLQVLQVGKGATGISLR